ncbi:uncharacterized protein LOC133196874 [Saccostrea echinata]|uniref:uncharacterized protein LOC133196874 n=1 Tax=Saccostrea echinata TaxID=191078 RepID=UPI002A7F193D|nr:uncharacterized protein LOC133196874 [Saccostrea echinata]
MLWMPLNWSILFVSVVVAESRKSRPNHDILLDIKKQKLLSLINELRNSYTSRDNSNEEQNWQEYKVTMDPTDSTPQSFLDELFPKCKNFSMWCAFKQLFPGENFTDVEYGDVKEEAREILESESRKRTDDLSSWGKYTCSWRIGCLVVCLLITLKRDYLWKRKLESVSRIDASVQCCIMSDWPEENSYVPYFAPLREDDLEIDASGRKCSNFYSLSGIKDKKYELIRKLSKHLAVGEAIQRVGIFLGLTATDICIIRQDYKGDSKEIAYRCLKKWTEVRPSEGRKELEDAIIKAGLGGILHRII